VAAEQGRYILRKTQTVNQWLSKFWRFDPDSSKRKRFEREIRFCSQDVHPNIIGILGNGIYVDSTGERPLYVMPVYDGTLEKYLEGNPSNQERLRVFVEILRGVEAAHLKGITHRDIKAKNILVNKDGSKVVVADFGIARFVTEQIQQEAAITKPGDRLANFEYAAPEQLRPGQEIDEKTDIFSLGLLLYCIFTGVIPRGANPKTISSVAPEYPYLDEIAVAMTQNDRASRPQSIAEVERMLIQRGLDFVEQQRLDELKNKVIPTSQLSDPMIDDPIRIESADWESGALVLTLNQAPNEQWIQTLRSLRSFGGVGQAVPMNVGISGNQARIPAQEHYFEIAYNHALTWLAQANIEYAENQRRMLRENEERNRRDLQDRIRRQEEEMATRTRVRERLAKLPK
jgi:serine/threonine protein kinase